MDQLRAAAEKVLRERFEERRRSFGWTDVMLEKHKFGVTWFDEPERMPTFMDAWTEAQWIGWKDAIAAPSERQEEAIDHAQAFACGHDAGWQAAMAHVASRQEAAAAGQGEREAFEAEVRRHLDPARANFYLVRDEHGRYHEWGVMLAWECWQARASLPASPSQGQWQPIDTVPESGYFMVYEDEAYRLKLRHGGKWLDTAYPGIVVAPWGDVAVGADAQRMLDIIGPGHKLVVRDGCCDNPTHWMPLPAAPSQPAQDQS